MLDRIEFEVDGNVVHLYVHHKEAERLIKESAKGKGQPLAGPYFFRKDPPHTPPPIGKYHLHIYKKQDHLFAINWDGSGHDNSKGKEIPNAVFDAIRSKWPDLKLPPGQIIESFDPLTLGKTFKTAAVIDFPLADLPKLQQLLRETEVPR